MNQQLHEHSESTSASLLQRVRLRDPDAWQRFAAIYTPLVYGWARRGGLQENDAVDMVQEVFRSIFKNINDYKQLDPQSRFRGWLWAITRNCVRQFYRTRARQAQAIGGSDAAIHLGQLPDLFAAEEEQITAEDQRGVVLRALDAVKRDFSAETWSAFWRLAVDGHGAAEIATDLKLSVAAVRQAKYRVLCRLREELSGF